MEANELRIGNIVMNYKYEICQIKHFYSGEAYSDGKKDNHGLCVYSIGGSKPIKINEIWLKKLGFESIGLFVKGDFEVGLDSDDFLLDQMTLRYKKCIVLKIKYVHQLQNLYFALTGEELELKTD